MAKYTVYFQKRGGGSRNGYTVDASSESEAISKWRQTIAGKTGENEVIDVKRV